MHSFARRRHSESSEATVKATRGLVLNSGWRYDLMEWFMDTFLLRGKLRELRQRTANLARLQPGETVLDVCSGVGTLAIQAQKRVRATVHVFVLHPAPHQIAPS